MASITGTTDVAAGTYIANIIGGENWAHHFGSMGACFGVGMVASPVAGRLLGAISFCLARFDDDSENL